MAKKGLMALFIIILGLTTVVSSTVYADSVTINADHLNVRSGPGTGYASLGKVNTGESYSIIDEKNEWLKIKWHNQTGWVAKKFANVKSKESSLAAKVDHLRIHSSPGLSSSIKGYLMKGDKVNVKDRKGKWVLIEHSNTQGWVHSDYLTNSVSAVSGESSAGKTQKSLGELTITTSILNVRNQSSTNGSIVGQVYNSENYDYISEQQGWYEIELHNGKTGWVAGWFTSKDHTDSSQDSSSSYVTLQYNGTHLRSGPSTNHQIVGSGKQGDQYNVLSTEGEWYKVSFKGKQAFVAGWIVDEHNGTSSSAPSSNGTLNGKTIMIDPGHGGRDTGALGFTGTTEKTITLQTAEHLKQQLESYGAKVILTRNSDQYVSLSIRSATSKSSNADAFISLHFNSVPSSIAANGIGSYYYHDKDQSLASNIQSEMVQSTGLRSRGVHFGDFHVIRENNKPAVLLELGFISDRNEEQTVKGVHYQTKVSQGITNGLIRYFAS